MALHKRGLLAEYWTGVPAGRVTRLFPRLEKRYGRIDLPADLVRWKPFPALIRKAAGAFGAAFAQHVQDFGHARFDRAVASALRGDRFDAVIGYEGATGRAFGMARSRGIVTILDAASLHHTAQHNMIGGAPTSQAHRRAISKEEEIWLADAIIVASTLARDSYLAAGVPAAGIRVVPLGVDLSVFHPFEGGSVEPFTFVFAGNVTRAKGVDLLLEAFSSLNRRNGSIRLRVFGSGDLERSGSLPDIEWRGRVPHSVVSEELRRADCLVLPSRLDSFGLIVAEALASGVPAIVSDAVGARDLVLKEGSGWIFPSGDAAALRAIMQWVSDHRSLRDEWRVAARASVSGAGWGGYHERFADTVEGILRQRGEMR
jgi:glycosyltransferase involved in cell wall biosynthesis